MGKNVQEYGVKTIKSVENKYLWSTFLVEVLVCLDEADRQKIKPLEMSDVRQLTPAACILVTLRIGRLPFGQQQGSTLLSQIQMFSPLFVHLQNIC